MLLTVLLLTSSVVVASTLVEVYGSKVKLRLAANLKFRRNRAFCPDFLTQSTFFSEKFSGKASLKSSIMLKRSIL